MRMCVFHFLFSDEYDCCKTTFVVYAYRYKIHIVVNVTKETHIKDNSYFIEI